VVSYAAERVYVEYEVDGWQMKRLLSVASVAHALCGSFSDAYAEGPFDGEWNGSAMAMAGQCKPAIVTVIVLGKTVTGRATFERSAQEIYGTVWEDGTFGATIGFQHLTGKFIQDVFEGTFSGFGCAWKISLRAKKPQ
jgi:hypothetical protein